MARTKGLMKVYPYSDEFKLMAVSTRPLTGALK
jgi:hypothetical protein